MFGTEVVHFLGGKVTFAENYEVILIMDDVLIRISKHINHGLICY